MYMYRASQVALVVKNLSVNAGRYKRYGFDPGLGRSPGGGHGNSFRYSCLDNPMDRGTWWTTVYRVTKSWTPVSRLNMHARTHVCVYICFFAIHIYFFLFILHSYSTTSPIH